MWQMRIKYVINKNVIKHMIMLLNMWPMRIKHVTNENKSCDQWACYKIHDQLECYKTYDNVIKTWSIRMLYKYVFGMESKHAINVNCIKTWSMRMF